MAKIRIYDDENDEDAFPHRCVKCGQAEPEARVKQKFTWMPPWVFVFIFLGLLPLLIAALITRKSRSVTLPLCAAHRGHWRNRKLFVWLGLLFWLVFGFAIIAMWDTLGSEASGVLGGVLLFGGFAWLITAALYSTAPSAPRRSRRNTWNLSA